MFFGEAKLRPQRLLDVRSLERIFNVCGCDCDLDTKTSIVDGDFADAQSFAVGVQTLNDDVARQLSGRSTVDADHLANGHFDAGHRATESVRAGVHLRASGW